VLVGLCLAAYMLFHRKDPLSSGAIVLLTSYPGFTLIGMAIWPD
jgi:hypothetical protein